MDNGRHSDPRGTAMGQTTWQAYIWSQGRDCLLSKPPTATCAFTTQNMSCKKTASHSDSFIILHVCYRCPLCTPMHLIYMLMTVSVRYSLMYLPLCKLGVVCGIALPKRSLETDSHGFVQTSFLYSF